MPNLQIKYYDREKKMQVVIDVPADVVAILIPAQPDDGLPALEVNVNTDAVLVDRADVPSRVWLQTYIEMLADIGPAEGRSCKT